jgi:hypothetical protein
VEVPPSSVDEWDRLATALNRRGVLHVAPARARRAGVPTSDRALFERLFRSADPRLQQAAVVLLLTHPESAPEARAAIAALEGAVKDRAMRRYVAAAALQRMARTRIASHLGNQPPISPAYLAELGVPPLDTEFGRAALLAVAEQEEALYGHDAWGTYRTLLDLFLGEIRRSRWGRRAVAG